MLGVGKRLFTRPAFNGFSSRRGLGLIPYFAGKESVPQLRREMRHHGSGGDLRRRRSIIALSLAGVAAMAPVVLYQTGLLRHLPDPPGRRFNADRIASAREAYRMGVPEATVALASMAVNIPLAACGGRARTRDEGWIPLLATGKALGEAWASVSYLLKTQSRRKSWCAYCLTGALTSVAIAALTLPEAWKAIRGGRR